MILQEVLQNFFLCFLREILQEISKELIQKKSVGIPLAITVRVLTEISPECATEMYA